MNLELHFALWLFNVLLWSLEYASKYCPLFNTLCFKPVSQPAGYRVMLMTWVRLQSDAYLFAAPVSHIDLLPHCQERNSNTLFMSWVSERMEQLPLTFLKRRGVMGSPFFMKQNETPLILFQI